MPGSQYTDALSTGPLNTNHGILGGIEHGADAGQHTAHDEMM